MLLMNFWWVIWMSDEQPRPSRCLLGGLHEALLRVVGEMGRNDWIWLCRDHPYPVIILLKAELEMWGMTVWQEDQTRLVLFSQVIDMPEHNSGDTRGTMRLGIRRTVFKVENSVLSKCLKSLCLLAPCPASFQQLLLSLHGSATRLLPWQALAHTCEYESKSEGRVLIQTQHLGIFFPFH